MPVDHDQKQGAEHCPDADTLRHFVCGRLKVAALEAIAEHVETCAQCGETIQRVQVDDDELLGALGCPGDDDPLDANDCAAVVAAVAEIAAGHAASDEPPPAADPAHPQHIGRYEILSKLGQGGMGTVYKARHVNLGKTVALKMLAADRTRDVAAVARLRREMKAVGALAHPNIVGSHDADEIDGVHFLVLEYVAGLDLSAVVGRCGPLAVADACEVVRQAAVGLDYAHRQGLVHRDVKPSNLMLTPEGVVKLLDLGLALLDTADEHDELTGSGAMMGTFDYMAPEQFNDSHKVDARADLYALGCTLFKLLTGRAPFVGPQYDGRLRKMKAHASHEPPALEQLRPDVSPKLAKFVRCLLAKQPSDRFATAGALARALEPFVVGARPAEVYRLAQTSQSGRAGDDACGSASVATDVDLASSFSGTQSHLVVSRVSRKYRVKRSTAIVAAAVCTTLLAYMTIAPVMNRRSELETPLIGSDGSTVVVPAADVASSRTSPPPAVAPFNAVQARRHQEAWASHLGTTLETANSLGVKLTLIPPGEFEMGSRDSPEEVKRLYELPPRTKRDASEFPGEFPLHRVRISRAFYLGTHEITRGQFARFVRQAAYEPQSIRTGTGIRVWKRSVDGFDAPDPLYSWLDPGFSQTDDHPVVGVTWSDAVAFCTWLSAQENRQYRLPTEAEWEYASRAGANSRYPWGDDHAGAASYANTALNDDGFGRSTTQVGRFPGNQFGLFDLGGNVSEWCADFYDTAYYARSAATDPAGPQRSSGPRVVRDGNWNASCYAGRVAMRAKAAATDASANVGFRVVREIPLPPAAAASKITSELTQAGTSTAGPPTAVAPFDAAAARLHQQAWAEYLATTVETFNSIGTKMVLVPPGEYLMGSTPEQVGAAVQLASETGKSSPPGNNISSERPQHRVVISRPVRFGSSEVTVGEFRHFVEATRYVTESERYGFGNSALVSIADSRQMTAGRNWQATGITPHAGDVMPVMQVTWNDAVAFCRWLTEREGMVYRLPTEAEWEWACRAGSTTLFSFGDDAVRVYDYAWCASAEKSARPNRGGLKLSNAFGLYDLHGNLSEWCSDFHEDGWYSRSPSDDPAGPADGTKHAVRGGNWNRTALYCRSAARDAHEPTWRDNYTGFRIVSELAGPGDTAISRSGE